MVDCLYRKCPTVINYQEKHVAISTNACHWDGILKGTSFVSLVRRSRVEFLSLSKLL